MKAFIREFTMEDYEAAYKLWSATPGVGLSPSDEPESIRSFLLRNPGLSFAAVDPETGLVGTVLGGHDGRRGFLYHLAVRTDARGQGIGESLAAAALEGLRKQNIDKCHIMVLADNTVGQGFWTKVGWSKRDNLYIYSTMLQASCRDDACPC